MDNFQLLGEISDSDFASPILLQNKEMNKFVAKDEIILETENEEVSSQDDTRPQTNDLQNFYNNTQ